MKYSQLKTIREAIWLKKIDSIKGKKEKKPALRRLRASLLKLSIGTPASYFLLKYSSLSFLLQWRNTTQPPFPDSAVQAGAGAAGLAAGAAPSTKWSRMPGQTTSFLKSPLQVYLATLPQPEKRMPIRATINKLRIMHNLSGTSST